ncbi:iron-sulfur cluster assembly protein IscA [Enterobacterales bacterium endosymbiont of Anomoneura mori]|uniref:iron-sulfur cluster assembly accessory protein n=1 Tax=Enterobacterales bacterium endosymbiont of Anomoneura mori TaxID=3132096 RepID=UPI00399CCF17
MIINISDNAINYFFNLIKKNKKFGIRLGIKKSKCLNFKYNFKYINDLNNNDYIFKKKKIIIFIKKKNLIYFNNIKIDLIKKKFKTFLIFNNPNIKNKCKCGKSFNI